MSLASSAVNGPADDPLLAACLTIALKAGAAAPCPADPERRHRTFDNAAEVRAFADAALAQAQGELAGYPLGRVIGRLGWLLDSLQGECPGCAGSGRATAAIL